MSSLLRLAGLVAEEREMIRRNWGWYVALGIILAVLGVAGLVFVGMLTLVSVLFVGWCFLIGGVLEVAHAIVRKGWSGFWLDLLSGVVIGLAGLLIVLRPVAGASILTVFIGIVFLVGGIFRIGTAVALRNPYVGWFILLGAIEILLALLILSDWPYSALWVIGTLVGIDLLIEGVRLVSFGLAAHHLAPIGGDEERTPRPTPAT